MTPIIINLIAFRHFFLFSSLELANTNKNIACIKVYTQPITIKIITTANTVSIILSKLVPWESVSAMRVS